MGSEPPKNVILLLTHSGDHFTVDRVAQALRRRGARPFRFDTDCFPDRVELSVKLGTGPPSYVLRDRTRVLSAKDVQAVWARRIWFPRMIDDLEPDFRDACVNESMAAMEGFLDGLHSVRWVNPPAKEREAENKLLQLRTAMEVGLHVPRTLVTNNSQRMRRFHKEVSRNMVAKLLRPVSVGMDASPSFVYTSEVTTRDLDRADLLRHSPMVFQERVAKRRELRIAFVAGKFFVGAIDTGRSSDGQVDWRLSDSSEARWIRDEIPEKLAARLARLMSKLGLVYGAIDLIRTPDNDHVFLEVNPGGEWGMLERDLAYPISDAIAAALLD